MKTTPAKGQRVRWRPDSTTDIEGEVVRTDGPMLAVIRFIGRTGRPSHRPCFISDLEPLENV